MAYSRPATSSDGSAYPDMRMAATVVRQRELLQKLYDDLDAEQRRDAGNLFQAMLARLERGEPLSTGDVVKAAEAATPKDTEAERVAEVNNEIQEDVDQQARQYLQQAQAEQEEELDQAQVKATQKQAEASEKTTKEVVNELKETAVKAEEVQKIAEEEPPEPAKPAVPLSEAEKAEIIVSEFKKVVEEAGKEQGEISFHPFYSASRGDAGHSPEPAPEPATAPAA